MSKYFLLPLIYLLIAMSVIFLSGKFYNRDINKVTADIKSNKYLYLNKIYTVIGFTWFLLGLFTTFYIINQIT